MAKKIVPTLADFERLREAIDDKVDLGNALVEGLEKALAKDLDGSDLEKALLFLDMDNVNPAVVLWRRRFIEEALDELNAREALQDFLGDHG
jgi:hypothetical protein